MSIKANLAITLQNRKVCKKIIDSLSMDQLNATPSGFNINILWNCAHIVSVQQMLTYGLTDQPFAINKEDVFRFSPGTKPESVYDSDFSDYVKTVLYTSFEQLTHDINEGKFITFRPFITALKFEINDLESAIAFNQYHEALHMGHILNIRKFV